MNIIEDAVLVVAHPDDEILWFSSVLEQCKRVIVCFGPSARHNESWDPGREALIDSYPLSKAKFLKVRQSEAFQSFNWRRPTVSPAGELSLRRPDARYAENSQQLLALLRRELECERVVFTHNPWGEYGHEEHVQVFNAVSALRDSADFDMFVNSYTSNRSHALMLRSLKWLADDRIGQSHIVRSTDAELAVKFKQLYLDHGCWTWMEDYSWPAAEAFYRVVRTPVTKAPGTTATIPLNYVQFRFTSTAAERVVGRLLPTRAKTAIRNRLC